MRRAFTLLETVVATALVGVTTALLLPSIGSVRDRARDTRSLAQLRQHMSIFGAYEADQRGYFPHFTDPRATLSVVRNRDRGFAVAIPYFGAHFAWNVALAETYYDGDHLSPAFASPADPSQARSVYSGYWYTCSAMAAPQFWHPRSRVGSAQWGAVLVSQTLFPSRKGILLDASAWRSDASRAASARSHIAFADASALTTNPDRLGEAYPGGEAPAPGSLHGTSFPPVHHTINGVQGRDLP